MIMITIKRIPPYLIQRIEILTSSMYKCSNDDDDDDDYDDDQTDNEDGDDGYDEGRSGKWKKAPQCDANGNPIGAG